MPYATTQLLPDAPALAREILLQCGAKVSSDAPADLVAKVPWLLVYRIGGAAIHGRFLDRATLQIVAFHNTPVGARDLAETARALLWEAYERQWSGDLGVLSGLDEVSGPSEIRTEGQPDGLWRFDYTCSIRVRPSQVP